jgi:hypothetical protein
MTNTLCPKCGSPLERADAPCPICLLRLASGKTSDETDGNSVQGLDVDFVQQMFPDLEIVETIGRGGMGTVYKARQPKLDRFVALKILSENLAAKPVFAERFAREGKILAKLNHPNIVSVYDFGQVEVGDTSLFYLILEYVDGVNLRQAMREEKFTPEQHDSPETVDHRADIYSLGVVFYELLTGELPRGSFPPPSANTPVNVEIDGIVLKALKKNREQRQQTAFELKTEIETVTITQKENDTMTPNEEHFEQPQQAANEQQPPPKWNEVGTVEKSDWKVPLFIVLAAILVPIMVGGFVFLPAGLAPDADATVLIVFGAATLTTFMIIVGIVLIVYIVTKQNKTAPPNIPHVDQSTLFCTHCGGRLTGNVYACPHCGFAPRSERNFCFHCGVATNPKQVMCIACGFPLQVPFSSQVSSLLKAKKDKVAAGILALFLGWLGIHKL